MLLQNSNYVANLFYVIFSNKNNFFKKKLCQSIAFMDLIWFGIIFIKIIFKWLVNQIYGLEDVGFQNFEPAKIPCRPLLILLSSCNHNKSSCSVGACEGGKEVRGDVRIANSCYIRL